MPTLNAWPASLRRPAPPATLAQLLALTTVDPDHSMGLLTACLAALRKASNADDTGFRAVVGAEIADGTGVALNVALDNEQVRSEARTIRVEMGSRRWHPEQNSAHRMAGGHWRIP